MNKIFTLISTLTFVAISFAAPSLSVSSDVMDFLNSDGNSGNHVALSKAGSQNARDVQKLAKILTIKKNSFNSVVKESMLKKFKNAKMLSENQLAVFADNSTKADLSCMEISERECANSVLKAFLPKKVVNDFDLLRVGTETEEREDGQKKVSAYIFAFQRVVNKRIVRNNNNTLVMSVDPDGYLLHLEMGYSDLNETSLEIETSSNGNECVNELSETITENYSSITSDGKNVSVDNVDVNGAVDAYCGSEIDGNQILVPCLSYSAMATLEDGFSFGTLVDANYSATAKKSLHDMIAGNKLSKSTNTLMTKNGLDFHLVRNESTIGAVFYSANESRGSLTLVNSLGRTIATKNFDSKVGSNSVNLITNYRGSALMILKNGSEKSVKKIIID